MQEAKKTEASIFYNEWDSFPAQWLRNLGEAGHIPNGEVCEKSITDLKGSDLEGYSQCHFFAGIGGWPLALKMSGLDCISGIWTGSPPCQPFSVAGKEKGKNDERHLAPVWLDLIRECKPPIIFGEQVADAIRHGWLDDLFNALEECGYTCGSAVLPACGIGAPHIRKRLFFGAIRMAHTHNAGPQGWEGVSERADEQPPGTRGVESGPANSYHSIWSGADWIGCRDGKLRPVEPGTQPMDNGIPGRVGRLRGYGNAIVPQVAAVFIESFMDSVRDIVRKGAEK